MHWHTGRADHLHVSPAAGEDRTVPLPPVDGYEAELREFIRCVESGQPSDVATAESALDALRLVHREMDSAQRGEMLSAG